jgi:hypothetical protein
MLTVSGKTKGPLTARFGKRLHASKSVPEHIADLPLFKVVRITQASPLAGFLITPAVILAQDSTDYGSTGSRYQTVAPQFVKVYETSGGTVSITGGPDTGSFSVTDIGVPGAYSASVGYEFPDQYKETPRLLGSTQISTVNTTGTGTTVIDVYCRLQ